MSKRKRLGPPRQSSRGPSGPPSGKPPAGAPKGRPRGGPCGPGAGSGRVRLFGVHAVRAALRNPARRLHRLWLSENAAKALESDIAALGARAPAVERDPRAALDRLLPEGSVHQGAVLETDPLDGPDLGELVSGGDAPALIVLLDQITDPQNAGAILRSAAAFGARGVVMTHRHAPPESGALAKAAAGALDTVPVARVGNLARALDTLKEAGFWVAGLDGDAEIAIDAVDPAPRTALVLGAEGKGLRRLTAETCDTLLRIPIAADADGATAIESLNVSNAAAIALFALGRARR